MREMKKTSGVINKALIEKLLKLANLQVSEDQKNQLLPQVGAVLQYVSQIQSLPLAKVEEVSQVTGQENVWREDEIQPERILTQEEVLLNAADTYNGFFVVPAIF